METENARQFHTEPAPTDEVRDMFEQPARWPEPKREIPRRERTSPYLTKDEESASAPARRLNPYAEPLRTPAPASETRPATRKKTSPYTEEVRTNLAPAAHAGYDRVLIDLKPSKLSLKDRLELARLKGSEAVHRIVWLPEDAVVTFRPGVEFGESRTLSWNQAGLETFGFALESLRRQARSLPLGRIGRTVGLYGAVVAGVFVFFNFPGITAQIDYTINPPATPAETKSAQLAAAQPQPAPTEEYRIVIPKLGVDAPVIISQGREWAYMKSELERGTAHYAGTAMPGEPGNVAITGHSSNYWWSKGAYNYVFTNLDKLAPGDEVTVYHQGKTYIYRVKNAADYCPVALSGDKCVVTPDRTEVINPTPTRTLTLITCWPRYTDWKRLVVSLDQINPAQPNVPKSSANHLPEI